MKERRAVHFLTDLQGVFECKSCLVKISLPEVQTTHPSIHHGNAVRNARRPRMWIASVPRATASTTPPRLGYQAPTALAGCEFAKARPTPPKRSPTTGLSRATWLRLSASTALG